MAYKASPENQKLGLTAEAELLDMLRKQLSARDSGAIVDQGFSDSRENGRYGDALIRANLFEAPKVMLELKGSTYPGSFSLSDYEKRVSLAKWVVVKGTMGIWCVQMKVAREFLTPKGTENDRYWVCEPPWESHQSLRELLDDIQTEIGEL